MAKACNIYKCVYKRSTSFQWKVYLWLYKITESRNHDAILWEVRQCIKYPTLNKKPKCDWKSSSWGVWICSYVRDKRATERLNAGDKSRHDQQCWADNLCENAADRTALQLAVTACESMVVMRFHTQVSVGKHTHLPWVQNQANRRSHYMTRSHTWASAGECIFNPWLRIQNMNITMVGVRFRRYSAKAVSPSQRLSFVRVPVRKSIPPSFQIFTFKHALTLWVQRSNANATLLNVKHKLQETLSSQNKRCIYCPSWSTIAG